MRRKNRNLKKEIFEKVKEYHRENFKGKPFQAGLTAIPAAGKVFDEKEMISLVDASLDFWLTEGRFAKKFEQAFSKYLGVSHVALVNSGSSANLLAFTALTSPKLGERRINPGDEVIAVAAAFPTTVNPIIQNGCVPVFIDIDPDTLNVDAAKIEGAITAKTKAIFLAHSLGNPFGLDNVIKIAKRHNLFVIEDCCDALGSTYDGRFVGTFGDIGTFSFYPAHQITMGEGGAVVAKDHLCKLPFGYDHKYTYSHLGYNLKLTDMQAAVGLAQLKKLPVFIKARRKNFNYLRKNLDKYQKYFTFAKITPGADPSWFGFPITVKPGAGFSRARIIEFLGKNKIMTRMLFAGNITKQPYFEGINYRIYGELENTDYAMENTFWIGVYPGIEKEQAEFIVKTFDLFFERI